MINLRTSKTHSTTGLGGLGRRTRRTHSQRPNELKIDTGRRSSNFVPLEENTTAVDCAD
jgi:hypothetical protein